MNLKVEDTENDNWGSRMTLRMRKSRRKKNERVEHLINLKMKYEVKGAQWEQKHEKSAD